jgi:CheY-like chemotaxis protein
MLFPSLGGRVGSPVRARSAFPDSTVWSREDGPRDCRETAGRDLAGVRILVVEDEPLVGMMVKETLAEQGGMVVGLCEDVESALAEAESQAIDLAILDFRVRGGTISPVAAALSARGVPLIFVTGYDPSDLDLPYPRAGILAKPFHGSALIDLAIKILGPSARSSGNAPL